MITYHTKTGVISRNILYIIYNLFQTMDHVQYNNVTIYQYCQYSLENHDQILFNYSY
jgi:hypothetical protein